MLRLAGIGAALLAALVGLAAWSAAGGQALEARRLEAESSLSRAERVLERSMRVEAQDTEATALGWARDEELVRALALADAQERQRAVFGRIERKAAALASEAVLRPDLVMLVDAAGKLVARNLDPLASGDDLRAREKTVGGALEGRMLADLWLVSHRLMRMGLAPVRDKGKVLGAVIIGFAVAAEHADAARELLGVDGIAYLVDGQVVATSIRKGRDEGLGATIVEALTPEARRGPMPRPVAAPELTLGGEAHRARLVPLPFGEAHAARALLLANATAAAVPLATVQGLLLGVGGAGALLAMLAALGTAAYFRRALASLEAEVDRVAGGELEAAVDAPVPVLEGLASGIEGLRQRLRGTSRGDDDAWETLVLFGEDEAVAPPLSGDAELERIGAEPEATYLQRTFDEFIAARAAVGAPFEGITPAAFAEKLREKERVLKERYGGTRIRFLVERRGEQVVLRPVMLGQAA